MPNDKHGGFGGVSIKPTIDIPNPDPKSINTQNLTSALRATLTVVEKEENKRGLTAPDEEIPSPLLEATPDSIDILLERINNHMIEGKILTDDDLRQGIDLYRAQALKFAQEQETKKPRTRRGEKSKLNSVLDLDLELEF